MTSSSADLLEGVFDEEVLLHFLLHLLFQEERVETVHEELLLHLDLVLILVLICSQLRDLLLPIDTLNASLECTRFVGA